MTCYVISIYCDIMCNHEKYSHVVKVVNSAAECTQAAATSAETQLCFFFLTQGRVPSGLRGNSTVLCIVINYMIQSGEALPQAVFSKYGHLNYTAQEWCYSWRIFKAVNFYDFFFPKCMKVCVCVSVSWGKAFLQSEITSGQLSLL